MRVADFDFDLPDELIARHPPTVRGDSRLLLLDGRDGRLAHHAFADLVELLEPGDLLVFNDTRVIPARLFGRKVTTGTARSGAGDGGGGKVEILVERILDDGFSALAHVRASKSPKPGSDIQLADGSRLRMRERRDERFLLEFPEPVLELLERSGHMPLPPYIDRADEALDQTRYQTVYAREPGAVAAPTAGLHFDEPLLAMLRARGIASAHVTLHVGAGTFQPVRVETVAEHRMHSERVTVPAETAAAVNATHAAGHRVVAVGTTSVRSLESAALAAAEAGAPPGELRAFRGETDIFIHPGRQFRVTDALITNFHLPRSTLLMLVSAFAGTEHTLQAYATAVRERYRFFSYGDAMFIPFPQPAARARA